MKSKPFIMLIMLMGLGACNNVYLKPDTLDKDAVIYVDRGGYQFQHSIKPHLEKRGYKVTVGYKKDRISSTFIASDDAESILSHAPDGKARYVIQINEQRPKFNPFGVRLTDFGGGALTCRLRTTKPAKKFWVGPDVGAHTVLCAN